MPAVRASVEALLASVVDYAGLFPPAKLDMKSTVENYARYLQGDESWMLGRLIVPVARLEEFEQCALDLLPKLEGASNEAWLISALTAPASDAAKLESDLIAIQNFNAKHKDAAAIDFIELKAESTADIDHAMDEIPSELFPFFELPIDRDPRGLIAALADCDAGAKVRTGGVAADAYPSPENLARFISACAAAHVPFKATAGLHHPLRHFSHALKTDEFGFLNVFVGAVLCGAGLLKQAELCALLQEQSLVNLKFSDRGISWGKHRIENADVDELRDELAVSFGSCSFEEPIADLRELKLL